MIGIFINLLFPWTVEPWFGGVTVAIHRTVISRLDRDLSTPFGRESARFVASTSDDEALNLKLAMSLAVRDSADVSLLHDAGEDLALAGHAEHVVGQLATRLPEGSTERALLANLFTDPDIHAHTGLDGILFAYEMSPSPALFQLAVQQGTLEAILPTLLGRIADSPPRWLPAATHALLLEGRPGAVESLYRATAALSESSHVRETVASALSHYRIRQLYGDDVLLKSLQIASVESAIDAVGEVAREGPYARRVQWARKIYEVDRRLFSILRRATRTALYEGNAKTVVMISYELLTVENAQDRLGLAHLFEPPEVRRRFGEKALRLGLQIRRTPRLLNNLGVMLWDEGREIRGHTLMRRAADRRPSDPTFRENTRSTWRAMSERQRIRAVCAYL